MFIMGLRHGITSIENETVYPPQYLTILKAFRENSVMLVVFCIVVHQSLY